MNECNECKSGKKARVTLFAFLRGEKIIKGGEPISTMPTKEHREDFRFYATREAGLKGKSGLEVSI